MRALLVGLLGIGVAGLAAGPERPALLVGLLVLLLAFLLGMAKLAVDLVDLSARELSADAIALVAVAVALTQITSGNRVVIGSLLGLALVAHAIPLALRRVPDRVG